MNREIKLIAHGGYSAAYPENTLESYRAALEFHPYAIEIDIIFNPQTGEFLCFHPSGVSSPAGTYSASEVQAQVAGDHDFPQLRDVLEELDGESSFLFDCKQPSEEMLRSLLTAASIDFSRVIIGVRSLEVMSFVKRLRPDVEVLALFADPAMAVDFAQEGGKFFRLFEQDVTQESVDQVHQLGIEVWVTPGKKSGPNQPRTAGEADEEKLRWLFQLGIDGILVNDVELAASVLEQLR